LYCFNARLISGKSWCLYWI